MNPRQSGRSTRIKQIQAHVFRRRDGEAAENRYSEGRDRKEGLASIVAVRYSKEGMDYEETVENGRSVAD